MKRRKAISTLSLLFLAMFLLTPMRVQAYSRTTDTYDDKDENKGDWNPVDHEAMEFQDGGVYQVEVVFIFTSVDTSKDAYKLDINYGGHEPGYWPWTESLMVYYRWGSSGSWTWHLTLDINPYDDEKTITDPTSSRLEVLFYDYANASDSCQTTWYFGHDGPILVIYEN